MKWAHYALRLPPELKLALESLALQNGRSLNAEIIQRLQASMNSYRR